MQAVLVSQHLIIIQLVAFGKMFNIITNVVFVIADLDIVFCAALIFDHPQQNKQTEI